jgi:dinuclear metal center YbgI/SA1388 family protein
MADRDEIIAFCDELLDAPAFDDYGPNGLQVPGAAGVQRIVSGVSANLALFEAAAEKGAQMCLVHHGLFWDKAAPALTEGLAGRLRVLLVNGISLVAYHLPLDAHPEIGNNALLCDALSLQADGRFASFGGVEIGVIGRSEEPLTVSELASRLEEAVGRRPEVFAEGPEAIRKVGIVTGDGGSALGEAATLGLDALLTGELSEPAPQEAREAGLHLIGGGHYATERLGIQKLGEVVAQRCGAAHTYVEVPNPI